MLKPGKHLNLQFSVLHIGGLIISILKERGMLKFDELLSILIEQTDIKVKQVFHSSLSFLFLLGKLKYHRELDAFELMGLENEID